MLKEQSSIKRRPGFSLVEGLLSAVVLGLIVTTMVGAFVYGRESARLAGARSRGSFVADEGIEAVRNIRDAAFSNLSAGAHGLAISGGQWIFSGSADAVDIFSRSLTIAAVDSRRKSFNVGVIWVQNPQRTGTITADGRLTDWRRDFADWSASSTADTLDLTGGTNATEIALYRTASNTYAVVVRNSSGAAELYVVDVTDPADISLVGSVDLGANANDVAVIGSHVVVASAADTQELQVVSLSTPSVPAVVGTLDLTGATNANAVAGFGDTIFIGRVGGGNQELYALSIATPSTPNLISGLELGTSIAKIVLAQNNSYIYAAAAADEFLVIDVSSPASMSLAGSFNAAGGADGTAVAAFSTSAVLGRGNGEIYVLNVSTPSSPSSVGGPIDIGASINDLSMGVGDIYIFAGTNTGGAQFQVLDVSVLTTPTVLETLSIGANISGVVWDFDLNRAFLSSAGTEVLVIQPN
jgi:hypothetical protein